MRVDIIHFCINTLCVLLLLSSTAFSGSQSKITESNRLRLSSTFALTWPNELQIQVGFMPTYRGFWLEGRNSGKPFSIWISRNKPITLANKFSVNRYWREGDSFSTSFGEKWTDQGCKEIQRYAYRCDGLSKGKSKRYAAQSLIWNSKSDLIVVRAMSSDSIADAKAVLDHLKFDISNRLPAGGVK
jgi:hypothetical protein